MKSIKYLLLLYGLLMACYTCAVTLPTTSGNAYSPVPSGYDEEYYTGSGIVIRNSFVHLGDYTACPPGDIPGETESGASCESCCKDNEPDEDLRAACISYCYGEEPPISPIDGGWWFLIVLAVLGAAFSVTMRKKLA